MNLVLASILSRKADLSEPFGGLLRLYLQRAARYAPVEHRVFPAEAKLLSYLEENAGRTRPVFLAADSTGKALTSPDLAALLSRAFDGGTQTLVLAVGPADGWSSLALKRADGTVSFGRITLPHELATVVAAEQLYRALTIRAGHPYHSGH